jgi:hypothetical protein
VDFGGGTLTSAGEQDIFLAKFDGNGTHLWSQRFGDADDQWCYSVASDPSGNVVVTGFFYGTVDFGGGLLTSAGLEDIFLAKFDANGTHLWSQRFGDAVDYQEGFSVASDPSGNVVMTGFFEGTVDFGGGTLFSLYNDIFLVKFGSTVGVEEKSSDFGLRNAECGLLQNKPNPFHSSAVIRYQIPSTNPESSISHHVSLNIYDLAGRLVETLVDEVQNPGLYQIPISSNQLPSSGVYFYRLTARGFDESSLYTTTKKMTFLR